MDIVLIAVALAMDAFAVSISIGLSQKTIPFRTAFRTSLNFGSFQFFMPVIGWYVASSFSKYIQAFDHWIAFFLLVGIGGKMIIETFEEGDRSNSKDRTKGLALVMLSIATSIDALAVGVAFAFVDRTIFFPSVIIGIVAFGFSYLGIKGGAKFGKLLGKKTEILGGIILIFIGVKILIEHLSI
ncbi:manganese efflux pump MntP family protein [Kosmotoga pacifica]|uniref:Putative manganese efflux pump MntP n=1 Tax=Kosmotoga pacifica TaxID=1330330 RepID=A0A0G2ZCQ1_9BACT|nr:manganese efflux pump MntP family protein [Kosmotoga pacifica]AKI97329.1 hypothetical protein IX53_05290 [Kosmotoga pacifica]